MKPEDRIGEARKQLGIASNDDELSKNQTQALDGIRTLLLAMEQSIDKQRQQEVMTDGGPGGAIDPLVCPRGHHSVAISSQSFRCKTCERNDREPCRWDKSELVDLREEQPPEDERELRADGGTPTIDTSELSDEEIEAVLQTPAFQKSLKYRRLAQGIEVLEEDDAIYRQLVATIGQYPLVYPGSA